MIKFIISLIVISLSSYAGDTARVGNGGGVLFCSTPQSTTLLDFYEAEQDGKFSFKNLLQLSSEERISLFLNRLRENNEQVSELFSNLLSYFNERSSSLKSVKFKIPNDFKNIFHDKSCNLEVVIMQRKPILSFEKAFFINSDLFNQVDPITRDGLRLHEILYFVALENGAKDSRQTREALSYIMSDNYQYDQNIFKKEFMSKIFSFGYFKCKSLKKYGVQCDEN